MATPLIEVRGIHKFFGKLVALADISFGVQAGEVHCLLGDNGAGKSTLIKILSGAHPPSRGKIRVDGETVTFDSPKEALDRGIATVYQDLSLVPLMSVGRNFFLGREPLKGWPLFNAMDLERINRQTREALAAMGITIRDPAQPVGTLSGGERQSLAIARAVHFGAKVLILDEPTSALGVHQASVVLKLIAEAGTRGIGVVFITHNVHHAYAIGDRFTLLNHGRSMGTFDRADITRETLLGMMAGGRELVNLEKALATLRAGRGSVSTLRG